MLKKWGADKEHDKTSNDNQDIQNDMSREPGQIKRNQSVNNRQVNTILKGSKLIGDINVSCDLELHGDVEGNITAQRDSNIVIKGICKGNIETKGGNVDIQGELRSGNITTGGNVSIIGKCKGGEVKAKGKIFTNSEFNGKLDGNEIEIGPNAQVKGELFYKEFITIARGAKVEVRLCCVHEEVKTEKNLPEKKVVDIQSHANQLVEAK